MQGQFSQLLERLLGLLRISPVVDWSSAKAASWQRGRWQSEFAAYNAVGGTRLDDLLHIDRQKQALVQNTQQFVAGLPANNALLWGARGSGKSSLVHGLLDAFAVNGLRLVEVDKSVLCDIGEIVQRLVDQPYKFIVFCDDLSFEEDDSSYKSLKSALDGSVLAKAPNILIYATSNRRHLLAERASDNDASGLKDGELHHGEAVEEKISLSDRFGLWLSFYPFRQAQYLNMVGNAVNLWVQRTAPEFVGLEVFQLDTYRQEALRWALARGVRNGRCAEHFARHWVGLQIHKLRAESV